MRHALCAALVTLIVAPASAQSPSAQPPGKALTAKTWTAPRTPDGQPDLQGIWLNNGATPLERPKQFEGKATLSDEEVAELKRRAARIFDDSVNSDFPGGDGFFLALLANPDRYRNPGSTGGADAAMIERVFDNRTSLISDPPDGRIPAMTAEGRERLAKAPTATGAGNRPIAGPEDFSLPLRCISYGIPRLGTTNIAGAGPLGYYQIVQTPGYVVLFLEAIHETRIIPLTARAHLPDGLRQLSGDSRGHWEGQTLVVDTTNFSRLGNFMGSAEGLHLVEHFTRVANDTLDYQITISDPSTWTKPWTALIHLKQREEPIFEYACHEGNYDVMRGMLLGAR